MTTVSSRCQLALARALATELDSFLGGNRTLRQIGLIEGAINDAESLRDRLSWFDDLEEAAASVAPGEGPEFLDFDDFRMIALKAREEIAREFGDRPT